MNSSLQDTVSGFPDDYEFQHDLSGHRIVHTGQGKSELAAREFKAAGAFAFVVGLVSLCASIPN